VLIVDDWAMAPLTDAERRAFLEICDERYMTRSTLLTSQLPVRSGMRQIGDPTVADSILDRAVACSSLGSSCKEESMRKKRGGRAAKMASRRRVGEVVLGANSRSPYGLLPLAPKKQGRPKGDISWPSRQRRASKTLDGCRSVLQTERALRRFAPI